MRTLSFLAPVLLVVACGGGAKEPAAPTTAPEPATSAAPATSGSAATSGIVPPGEAKIGDKTTCLISNEEFTVTASSPKVEHEGKTYYFCCPGCDNKFKADPKKYLGK